MKIGLVGYQGSGKSTLLHSIITSGAHHYHPDQLVYYLLDFKKGVEFKPYAESGLPHARVIGIESEREFGRSVLQRLDEELQQRGEKFRAAGVQELGDYRKATGQPLPRIMLVVDERPEDITEMVRETGPDERREVVASTFDEPASRHVAITDIVKETHQALNENRPEFYALPDNRPLASQEFLLFENTGADDLEDRVVAREAVLHRVGKRVQRLVLEIRRAAVPELGGEVGRVDHSR